ncbi:hypothetical protein N1851_022532 [Merluccius polli]|uniref:Uncharacterized protein n=1 Tax=Merluccius polli TaxID=89951 RepID=A0AA47NVS5_MERPO|nr:hypothetical protein N1851_022532 [Merluccius polli]
MLQSRVNQDSPTTSRALRNSGRTSSTPGALPPRSFLTTSATSAPEIGGPTPESPGPASLPEGVSVGLRRSLKYSFHRSTTSRVEVSSAPSPPYTVLTMHCFPLLRRRMVVQNLFEAVRKSFSMASPNSSHVRVFASVTATAALRLACRYLPAASGVPQAKKFDGIPHRRCPPAGSGIAATAGTDHLAATALVGRLNNGGVEHGPLGLNVPRLPRYMVKALPEVGVEALSDRRLCQTFPADPHDTFGSASSAPLFARVSKTCGRKSDDTTTKSIIELRPRVSWCQAQTTVRIRPPTRRRREATLSFTGVNSNILAPSRGAISIATPARRLSPVATPEWKRVQPLSRSLVPEPLLCVEVRPTISSRNFSTSRTSSGSFPTREVTFHVPRASFCSRGSDRQGPRLRPPPSSHCTRPLWPLLLVVSRREGGPTSSFRAVPGRAPPGHQALAAEPHPQAWLQGEAPGNLKLQELKELNSDNSGGLDSRDARCFTMRCCYLMPLLHAARTDANWLICVPPLERWRRSIQGRRYDVGRFDKPFLNAPQIDPLATSNRSKLDVKMFGGVRARDEVLKNGPAHPPGDRCEAAALSSEGVFSLRESRARARHIKTIKPKLGFVANGAARHE